MIPLLNAYRRVSQLWAAPEERMRVRAIHYAEKASKEIGVPCRKVRGNLWRATAPEKRGFVVKEDIQAYKQYIVLVAYAGITTQREFILRNLAIALLEFNQRFTCGSFRLDENEKGVSVVLGAVFDTTIEWYACQHGGERDHVGYATVTC